MKKLFSGRLTLLLPINTPMKRPTIKSYDLPLIIEDQKTWAENARRQLTITVLAQEAGINSSKLRIGHKQLFKTTIHQYRLDLRIAFAKQLLEETQPILIGVIAFKTDFNSRNGFARLFRRRFIESPREWRKAMSTDVLET